MNIALHTQPVTNPDQDLDNTSACSTSGNVRYSIIVIAYNVEQYITAALKSCLQTHDSYELIVIDNCSDDRTLALINQFTLAYTDTRVICNSENVGLGYGRNQGMALAKGEYILFLDGDDLFADANVLSSLDSIIASHSPDVIVCNHKRLLPAGHHEANPHTPLLIANPVCITPIEKAALFANFGVAWNKCYKKSFLCAHSLSFPKGIYEDISWNFLCLMHAGRVCATPKTLVTYRVRPGSILTTPGHQHLQVLDQYRPILTELQSHPFRTVYAEPVYRYAAGQLTAVVLNRRFSFPTLHAFQKGATALLQEFRRLSNIATPDFREDAMRYAPAAILLLVLRNKNNFLSVHRFYKRILCNPEELLFAFKLFVYRYLLTQLPLRRNAVYYESYWGQQVSCNPFYIWREALTQSHLKHYWAIQDTCNDNNLEDATTQPATTVVSWRSWAHLYRLATSRVLITNTNFSDFFIKRKNTIVINTQHGTPLKMMGLDMRPFAPRAMNWTNFSKRCQNWDYVLSSNPYSSEVWRSAMPYNYRILEIGYPRNDALVSPGTAINTSVRDMLGCAPDNSIALYAPTHRPYAMDFNDALNCIAPSLQHSSATEWRLLFRGHHLTPQLHDNGMDQIRINKMDITDLLLSCDLLITDYSSLLFDWLLLRRPIVFYCPDYERYKTTRGFYFNISDNPPGPIAFDRRTLEDILMRKTYLNSEYRQIQDQYRSTFCPYDDGHAAKRAVATFMLHSRPDAQLIH